MTRSCQLSPPPVPCSSRSRSGPLRLVSPVPPFYIEMIRSTTACISSLPFCGLITSRVWPRADALRVLGWVILESSERHVSISDSHTLVVEDIKTGRVSRGLAIFDCLCSDVGTVLADYTYFVVVHLIIALYIYMFSYWYSSVRLYRILSRRRCFPFHDEIRSKNSYYKEQVVRALKMNVFCYMVSKKFQLNFKKSPPSTTALVRAILERWKKRGYYLSC